MVWHIEDPQGNEAAKCKYEVVPYTRGVVLDMGCGPSKAFPHFIGVDNHKDTALFGIQMKPEVDCDVADPAAIEASFHRESVDAVFSSHCLEHIEDHEAALAAWWSLIKTGGYLVLYLPHRDLYPNIGTFGANPDHKHDFVPDDIVGAMQAILHASNTDMDIMVEEVRDQDREYSFLLVLKKMEPVAHDIIDPESYTCRKPRPAKTACVVRYGGFGDMLQASNILPELRRQGYHVTVMTTPKGQDILKHDPHVDDWFIQDEDQVPNGELSEFWAAQARRFDKFVNLSESVEGTLLALPGRANHSWPQAVRQQRLNVNYLEFTSELAELPYSSEAKFYPSEAERGEAREAIRDIVRQRTYAKHGDVVLVRSEPVFVILWALAGSSVHKFTPHQDAVIARVMLDLPQAVVILTGDEACQILEQGWEYEPRVLCLSGKQSIRQTLTLAQQAHCVVGPETGVLNAVAFDPAVAKVLMLSHSSHENLSKHWANTVALAPEGQHCYPCHRLHYSSRFCDVDPDIGAARCQMRIEPARIYAGIEQAHAAWKQSQKEAS